MSLVIVRVLLSIALLFGVYSETGGWTTLTLGLILLGTELNARILHKLTRHLSDKVLVVSR